ncbi:hypothetical protein MGH68_08835 [Erysipelothrix sp. D19-032]
MHFHLLMAGKEQYGVRGGTIDNTAAILWAKTLRLAREDNAKALPKIEKMQKYLYDTFENMEGVVINSSYEGSPYIFNVSILNVGSEIMMNGLNSAGFAVSRKVHVTQNHWPPHMF